MPFPLSVVAPMVPVLVPPLWLNTTVAPPVDRLLPAASFAWSVSVTALPDATLPADTLTIDWLVEMLPMLMVNVLDVALVSAPELAASV